MKRLTVFLVAAAMFAATAAAQTGPSVPTPIGQAPALEPTPIDAEPTPAKAAPTPKKAPPTARELIDIAFKMTSKAQSERDFDRVIMVIDRAMRSGELTQQYTGYATKLKGWCHNRRGEALSDKGRDTAALAQFELAVQMNGDHWKARHNRGVSYAVQGKFDEAVADFSQTIRLNPGYANAWFNRAEVRYKQGEMDAAIRDYDEAIRRNANDAGFFYARGNVYHRQRRYNNALDDYKRALEIDPQDAEIYVFRGDVWAELGDYDQAASDYRQAIKMNDQLGGAFRSIAWLMATCPVERFRDADRGVAAAQKALKLHGTEDHRYLETLAAALANAGRYDEALDAQQEAVKLIEKKSSPDQLESMRARMVFYQQKRPYRQQRIASRDGGRPN